MKKGIRAHDIPEKGLVNICARCRAAGITYLQLVLEKSVRGFTGGSFSEEYACSLKEQLRGMEIAILGSYIDPSSPDDAVLEENIEKFKEKIRYASVLEPIAVGTETGIYKEGETDTEEAYSRVLSTFRILVGEAEKYGVAIGIEGVWSFVINTPRKMKRLIDDLNSDSVKVIFDPVNYLNIDNYMDQDAIINAAFDLLADRICVLHAKDFTVADGVLKKAKIGKGALNYDLIFKRLRESGLDIPVICEEVGDMEAVLAFRRLEGKARA